MQVPFIKMSGAGNDFIIFDARKEDITLSDAKVIELSSRNNIGCDQLIVIKNSDKADCFMEIYNSDASLSAACGNATRCVASLLMDNKNEVNIQTRADILKCTKNGDLISVVMGVPKFNWQDIPLDQDHGAKVTLEGFEFNTVNIGNPHAVTFIEETLSDEQFFDIGPKIETNPIFTEKTNVEFVKIISDNLLEVRVWERGAGETLACGSGACAVGIIAIKNKLVSSNEVTTRFKGGDLIIKWQGDEVIMTGGYKTLFEDVVEI